MSQTEKTGDTSSSEELRRTPLDALHRSLGARMVPFAGYDMPLQYAPGILKEHEHTRTAAGLFDVSHMGQAFLVAENTGNGDTSHEVVAQALETMVPGSIKGLKPGRMRLTLLLNEQGGIMDDLMVTRAGGAEHQGWLFLVVNAATKEQDFAHLKKHLPADVELEIGDERALLALQGPKAADVLERVLPGVSDLTFMSGRRFERGENGYIVTRSGYTGEDGFEISLPADEATSFAETLLAHPDVAPIGLGARDSLRLEAGLCLYGHDMSTDTTPVEASLTWTIAKRRIRERNFPGAERILRQIEEGADEVRVGLRPLGKVPVREGCVIHSSDGAEIGKVTSGGFGPTVGAPVAMGYVRRDFSDVGQTVQISVRNRPVEAEVAELPFVPHRYHRKK